jgi:prevent-host-death family protein
MADETLVALSDMKNRLSEFVGRARDHHERFAITVHGEPVAVLVSAYEWESIIETLAILNDPEHIAQMRAAEVSGETFTADDLRADLAARTTTERTVA